MSPLIGKLNKKYVLVSNRLTESYEGPFSFFCGIYFPKNKPNPNKDGSYTDVNIFNPHQAAEYNDDPSLENVKFYIPHLLKKESMNSSEAEFDSFYLAGDADNRPFIETSKARELPIQSKVVVKLESSKMYFWVDKKTVINGADGHMLLRQYLAPLSEG